MRACFGEQEMKGYPSDHQGIEEKVFHSTCPGAHTQSNSKSWEVACTFWGVKSLLGSGQGPLGVFLSVRQPVPGCTGKMEPFRKEHC